MNLLLIILKEIPSSPLSVFPENQEKGNKLSKTSACPKVFILSFRSWIMLRIPIFYLLVNISLQHAFDNGFVC